MINFEDYVKMYIDYANNYSAITKTNNIYDNRKETILFESLMKEFIKKHTSADGDDGEISVQSFLAYLIIALGSKSKAKEFLKRIKNNEDSMETKVFIDNLIKELNNEEELAEEQTQVNYKNIETTTDYSSFDPIQLQILADKYNSYSTFALNKGLNKNFFPTTKATIDTSRFDEESRETLVNYFSKNNFYKLDSNQKNALFQAVVNEYCLSNGVKPCAVIIKDLPASESSICFGQYDPNAGAIYINKKLIDKLDLSEEYKNQYLPYQILSTLVHEAQHRVQFSNLDKENPTEKDILINNALLTPQENLSFSEYLASADELDARNSALEYIREMAAKTENPALEAFYNSKKETEDCNIKANIPTHTKAYFTDIYLNKSFDVLTPENIEKSKQEFYRIMNHSFSEYSK